MEDIYIGKRKNRISGYFGKLIRAAIVIAVFVLFFVGIYAISRGNTERQLESLEKAINRDVVQCYSLEGIYPPSLEYLEEHYGLVYDRNLFFVDYRPIAANIYPDITILRLDENAGEQP